MKKFYLLLSFLLFGCLSSQNIFLIGGFEKNIQYKWQWNIYPSDTKMEFKIIEDSKEAQEGYCYAKIYVPDYDVVGTIFSFFPVKQNTKYTLSFWYKNIDIMPDISNIKILLNFNKENGANGSAGRKLFNITENNNDNN
jgi:hypothetical protein